MNFRQEFVHGAMHMICARMQTFWIFSIACKISFLRGDIMVYSTQSL